MTDTQDMPEGEEAPAPASDKETETVHRLQPISEETELLYELVGNPHLLAVMMMVGASALLPVPFLDDVAKSYLERRMLRTIAEKEGMVLSPQEVERLTQEPPKGCCLVGCLGNVVVYPVKRLLRKVLFFLEIKRSMDQASTALAEGWLFWLALRRGFWSPGRDLAEADRLRNVIEGSCHSQGVKPLEMALRHAFAGAKGTLKQLAQRFAGKSLQDKAQLEAAVREIEAEEGETLVKLSKKLKEALSGLSEGYLQRFAEEFEKQMEQACQRPLEPAEP